MEHALGHAGPDPPSHPGPAEPRSQGWVQTRRRAAGCPGQPHLQQQTCREAKPALCCYYFLFIPQEEFIQSSSEQQDPGLFFFS